MNRKKMILLLPLLGGMLLAATDVSAQTDSTTVRNDSVAWSQLLDGVTVKAQRQLVRQEVDRMSYDVQSDDEARTQTVLDLLRKVPMVTVDGQDNILVKGSGQYRIYRNGHPDPNLSKNAKEMLRSMPASAVKRIEVITDPGAREDAEGVAAILNIVMADAQQLKGLTGSLTAAYNTLHHPNLNAYLATQLGRAVLSVDYGYGGMSERETRNSSQTERIYTSSGHRMEARNEGSNPGNVHFADLNASFDLDSLNLLTASFGGYFYKLNVQGSGTTSLYDAFGMLLYSYDDRYWMPDYSHHSWNGRLDYEHKTQHSGEQLTLSYMLALTRQRTEQQSAYTATGSVPFSYTGILVNTHEHFTEHTLQVDWLRPLWKGHKMEIGAKYIDRQNTSLTQQDFADSPYRQTEDAFDHTTRIAAAYADYLFSRGRWSARAGLRYEYSRMSGHYPDGREPSFTRRLGDWVPQASLKWQLTDVQSLKLSYTTSINRPGISYLNPAVVSSPMQEQQGNAHLSSDRQQQFTLLYMYVGQRLTLQMAPSFKFLRNGIGRRVWAEDDTRHTTFGNIERLSRWQLEGYAQWKPTDGTTLVANLNLWSDRLSNPGEQLRQHGSSAFYYLYGSQQLPWKLSFTAYTYGQVGHALDNVYSYTRSWSRYGFSIQRSFLSDDRLTVRLSATIPFHRPMHYRTCVVQGDVVGASDDVYAQNGRMFQLAVSYRFGKMKTSVKKTETTIDNSDVVGGITKGK